MNKFGLDPAFINWAACVMRAIRVLDPAFADDCCLGTFSRTIHVCMLDRFEKREPPQIMIDALYRWRNQQIAKIRSKNNG